MKYLEAANVLQHTDSIDFFKNEIDIYQAKTPLLQYSMLLCERQHVLCIKIKLNEDTTEIDTFQAQTPFLQ